MLIDKISYSSLIKDINPGIKFILSMVTLVFLLYTRNKMVFILNFLLQYFTFLITICNESVIILILNSR